jgi:hypothetical protein
MAGLRRVELHLTPTARGSSILLDGEPLTGVRAVNVSAGVGELTTVTVDLLVREATDLDAEQAIVQVPEQTAAALVALGWTPPPG